MMSSMVDKIFSTIADYRFRKEVLSKKSIHETVSFDDARKIGLLYDATDERNFEIMKQYVKHVRAQQKEVMALGYVDKKNLPQNQFAQLGLDFFTRKSLNWQKIPGSLEVKNFIQGSFDIVINLCDNRIFPLRYIAAVSNARFRVGRFDKRSVFCYDMMIETGEDTDLKNFIQQAEHFLRKIKT